MQIPTLHELGDRMSALDFAEWQAVLAHEGLLPAAARARHAELLAATFTGPAQRTDGAHWSRDHFMVRNVWEGAGEPPAANDDTEPDLEAHVQSHNARMKH